MKASAFLLSLYVMFLCIAPGVRAFTGNAISEKSCCEQCGRSAEQPSKPVKKQGKSKDLERVCNPFKMCKTCAGLFSYVATISFHPTTSTLHKLKPLKEEATKHLALDIWQPPKLS